MGCYVDVSERQKENWRKNNIESRDVKEPMLYSGAEVQMDMPDIRVEVQKTRESGVIGDSGADAVFCDTFQCAKEKSEIFHLCGLENHDDLVTQLLNKLCKEYVESHDRIKTIKTKIDKQQRLLEALAVKLGYDNAKFRDDRVVLTKKGFTTYFPAKWVNTDAGQPNMESTSESWDS